MEKKCLCGMKIEGNNIARITKENGDVEMCTICISEDF